MAVMYDTRRKSPTGFDEVGVNAFIGDIGLLFGNPSLQERIAVKILRIELLMSMSFEPSEGAALRRVSTALIAVSVAAFAVTIHVYCHFEVAEDGQEAICIRDLIACLSQPPRSLHLRPRAVTQL
jgi:hypothetical protein